MAFENQWEFAKRGNFMTRKHNFVRLYSKPHILRSRKSYIKSNVYCMVYFTRNLLQSDLDTIKEECIPYDEQGGGYGGPGSIKGEKEKGTFWPEKPKVDAAVAKASTVLTNLQRGNIPTIQQTRVEPVLISLHQRAGQGELRTAELEEDSTIVIQRDNKGKTALMWRY